MKEFAAYLRQEREARGVSLEKIQQQSRIRMQYLVAMEDGRFEVLPETTYVRAFLKHYASIVGMNADEVLRRYEEAREAAGLAVPERTTAMPLAEEGRSERRQRQLQARRRKRRMQWVGLFVLIALAVLLRVWDPLAWFNKDDGLRDNGPSPTTTGLAEGENVSGQDGSVPALSVSAVVADDGMRDGVSVHETVETGHSDTEAGETAHLDLDVASGRDERGSTSAADGNGAEDVAETVAQSNLTEAETSAALDHVVEQLDQAEASAAPAVAVEPEPAPDREAARRLWHDEIAALVRTPGNEPLVIAPYPGSDAITVTIHPVDEAWTELTVDGRRVVYRVLQAGEEVTYTFAQSLQLRLGRAESTLVTLGDEPVGRLGTGIVSKHFIVSGVE